MRSDTHNSLRGGTEWSRVGQQRESLLPSLPRKDRTNLRKTLQESEAESQSEVQKETNRPGAGIKAHRAASGNVGE